MNKAIFLDRDGVLNKVVLREKGKVIGSPKSLYELKLSPYIKKTSLYLKKKRVFINYDYQSTRLHKKKKY